jgi:hypothetical protein
MGREWDESNFRAVKYSTPSHTLFGKQDLQVLPEVFHLFAGSFSPPCWKCFT